MTAQRFRIGCVGLGMMGHSLAQTCRAEANVELVAGCDILPEARSAWQIAFQMPRHALYADLDTMLDDARLDVLLIATHAPLHHAAALAAAARGIHVFCEKPIALSLVHADAMLAACAQAGVRLGVNHIKRGSRANGVIRALIADGTIGTPYLFRGEGKGGRWAGSELMEMGTHIFDWLRILAGDPEWLFAHVVQNGVAAGRDQITHSLDLPYRERDCGLVLGERAYCSLALPGGVHADIGFLSQPSGDDTGYGFDICGTAGTLAVRRSLGTDVFLQRAEHRGPIGAPWEQIAVDEFADLPPAAGADPTDERQALQRRLLRDFLLAIEEGREPLSSGRDGLLALELSMAVWESQRLGRPMTLPLPKREHPLEQWRASAG